MTTTTWRRRLTRTSFSRTGPSRPVSAWGRPTPPMSKSSFSGRWASAPPGARATRLRPRASKPTARPQKPAQQLWKVLKKFLLNISLSFLMNFLYVFTDRSNDGVHVRIWNLPKKKNIHKDLNLAFKGFPGLVTINPANSGTKKTRDPICKGFAFVKLESVDAATRFVELYSRKAVSFGKVEKPIKCCIVEGHVSTDPSGPASSSQPPGLNPQRLVAVR
uniref:RRM domain-containing protein n=1 Tax=Aegilops tauschii subsp. strangulata TaxID=200361 RepID=A0A453RES8_AEGTS